jgi:DNA-binding response OmpR family regulator
MPKGQTMPKHILLIDDDRDVCKIKKAQLELGGSFKVTIANDPGKGLKLAKTKAPDLILLDVMMPGKDGFEVLAELKSDIRTTSIPVIMHTGVDEDEAKLHAAELYGEAYVAKTADSSSLVSAVNAVLARRPKA